MSHLVSPTAHRVGKTAPWKSNSIEYSAGAYAVKPNAATSKSNINLLLKRLLRRKRLFVVRSTAQYSVRSRQMRVHLLFAPRIKTRPRPDARGKFTRFVFFKEINWGSTRLVKSGRLYVKERRAKVYKMPRQKQRRLNKWLLRRMFRGSVPVKFRGKSEMLGRWGSRHRQTWLTEYAGRNRWFRLQRSSLQTKTPKWGWNRPVPAKTWKRWKRWEKDSYLDRRKRRGLISISGSLSARQLYLRQYVWKKFQFMKWWRILSSRKRQLNAARLSHRVSSLLKERAQVRVLNAFTYLAAKQMVHYNSHQSHFWHHAYRRYRFYYNNYYDIVNAFWLLGLIKHSETFLLDILRMMMPRIRKIRRFLYFLDAAVKNMPQIKGNFSCFRITLTGKIRGGTKRTKTYTIGFGHLPYNSITSEGSVAFTSYRHKFGEFGLKLIMDRTYPKVVTIESREETRWSIHADRTLSPFNSLGEIFFPTEKETHLINK